MLGRIKSWNVDGKTVTYDYDKTNQVTSDNGAEIKYDANGNRTSAGSTPIKGNRLRTDGTWTYDYNDAGQVTSKSANGVNWTYAYNLVGQLTKASDGTTTVEYTYDVFGNRIQRSETANSPTTVERYLVDGWDTAKPSTRGSENFDTWADLDANNQLTTRRVYGAGFDQPLLKESATGERAWYNRDHVNSKSFAFTAGVAGIETGPFAIVIAAVGGIIGFGVGYAAVGEVVD